MSRDDARMPNRDEQRLARVIGPWLGALIVVNATIGTGIFKTPAKVARLTGDVGAYLGVWVAGGVIALCGALTLAELAAALPRTGGLYEWLRRAWGRPVAFLFGWTMLVLLIPSALGGFARLAAEALAALAGAGPDRLRDTVLAIGVLAACAGANLFGVRTSARTQSGVAAAKYVGVAGLALVGLLVSTDGATVPLPADLPPVATGPTMAGVFAALVSVMWAYDGWADLARIGGEIREPARTLPRALLGGTVAIVFVYLFINAGYLNALGLEGLQRSTVGEHMPAAHLARLTLGETGRGLLGALVFVSCIGACLTSLLTAPRVFVPLGADGLFPASLGRVSESRGVPVRATVVAALVGMAYVSSRSFEQLTEAFVVGFFPFYILAVLAVFRLRRTAPDLTRPFRVPLYPWVPLVFLAGAGCLMVGALLDADRTAVFALGVMALGFPAQWLWQRFRGSPVGEGPPG
jgi:APA family basic amino acid/polyamine antiporter